MAGLVERWIGQAVLSDPSVRQVVVDKAVEVSADWAQEVQESRQAAEGHGPAINPTVKVYAPDTPEVLIFADDIQVKGSKRAPRDPREPARRRSDRTGHDRVSHVAVPHRAV